MRIFAQFPIQRGTADPEQSGRLRKIAVYGLNRLSNGSFLSIVDREKGKDFSVTGF
jgi:hypothetical protein